MWTPREHFENDVRPACEAYFADSTSQWKAKAAAQALNNFSEWTFLYFKENDPSRLRGFTKLSDFKTHHVSSCPEFQVVGDLAEAAKHRFLSSKLAQRVVTTSTGGWAERGDILAIVATGQEVDVLIGVTMAYWESQI